MNFRRVGKPEHPQLNTEMVHPIKHDSAYRQIMANIENIRKAEITG